MCSYVHKFLLHSLQQRLPGKIVRSKLENNSCVTRHKIHNCNRTVEHIPELDCTLHQQVHQHMQQMHSHKTIMISNQSLKLFPTI